MSRQEDKVIGRRLKTSYITTTASIALVLFVLGLLGLVMLFAQGLSTHVKENIGFTVFIHDTASHNDIISFQKELDNHPAVKSTAYISKEQAAEDLSATLGEDFVEFLGYNPLSASVSIRLHASYANPDSLAPFESELTKRRIVAEIDYQRNLVQMVNENVRRIGLGLLAFGILLLMIAFALINNTIRLSVFSKRFLIKSMQLVGATKGFIRKPFVIRGIIQGAIAAVISNSLIALVLYLAGKRVPELGLLSDTRMLAMLFSGVLLLGLMISWVSTWLAVRKFLKLNTDSLYYY